MEGLILSSGLKNEIAMDGRTSASFLSNTIRSWNSQANNTGANSKFVRSVLGNPTTGVITITYDPESVGLSAGANTLLLSPMVRMDNSREYESLGDALAHNNMGVIDWACSSDTHTTATAMGMTNVQNGTLPSVFAPATCR